MPRVDSLFRFVRRTVVAAAAAALLPLAVFAAAAPPANGNAPEDFDVRRIGRARAFDRRLPAAASRRLDAWRGNRAAAQAKLNERVPGVKIEYSPLLGVPEIVTGNATHLVSRDAAAGATREQVVRDFLRGNAELYGLTAQQVDSLRVVADYTNPAGNLSWIELQQEIHGLPVFLGTLRAAITADGSLGRVVGEVVPALDYSAISSTPALSAAAAVAEAAHSIGVKVNANQLTVRSVENDGRKVTFERGPFARETIVELQYFPLRAGEVVLAWSMVVWQETPAYYMYVDAHSGEVLFRKNITSHQSFTYNVYSGDSPAPGSHAVTPNPGTVAHPPCISRSNITVASEMTGGFTDPWLPAGATTTTGNNTDTYLDLDSDNVPDGRPTASGTTFSYAYTPGGCGASLGGDAPSGGAYRNGIVTNLFFQTNRFHDRMYAYGFTEAARNFQTNNFGRGGAGNDHVLAEAQDGATEKCTPLSCPRNNANFATPPDGQSGRCQMYIWDAPTPDRDGDLDMDIIFHELGHGVNGRLHGNAGGLAGNAGGGMNEGWADFISRGMLADAAEDPNGVYPMGAYATYQMSTCGTWGSNPAASYYYGIRNYPYAPIANVGANGKPHNPLTLEYVDPGKTRYAALEGAFADSCAIGNTANQVHNVGNVWATALNEVRAKIVGQFGFPTGNDRMMLLVIDGMKLNPTNPTLIQARDSIIEADRLGFSCASEQQIWEGFAARGWGFNASAPDLALAANSVTESYALPNLTVGTVSFTDCAGNGNDAADPGETIRINLPLTNPWCSKTATGVSVSIVGGGSAAYTDVRGRATSAQHIDYTVPAGAACGSLVTVTVNINSSFGAVTRTFQIRVGKQLGTPVALENFDGVTAPTLPAGWSMVTGGNQPRNWQTDAVYSVSAPNSARMMGPYPMDTTNNAITSALYTVPAGWGGAEVSFSHWFESEGGWDGGVLEISVNGGTYQDVITAGGSWVQNGYVAPMGSGSSNPLAGRNSWTGNSGGWIVTRVNMPATVVAGSTVRLRWRFAADNCCGPVDSDGDPIWVVDNVEWKDNRYTCFAVTSGSNTAMAAPTGVSARYLGNNRIDVSWTSNGARSYRVFRSSTPGGPYTQIGSVTTTTFSDTTIVQNATYYYVVRAAGCTESPNSAEVWASAVCDQPPSFVTSLTQVVAGAGTTCNLVVSWHPATASCSGGSITYNIYRDTSSTFTPSTTNSIAVRVSGTSYTDTTGLVAGTTYYYIVRAVDSTNGVEDTNTVRVPATVPAGCTTAVAPLKIFTARGSGGATSGANTLEWVAPAGGTLSLTIRYSTTAFPTSPTDGQAVPGTPLSITANASGTLTHGDDVPVGDTPLALNQTYYYAAFVNGGGATPFSVGRTVTSRPQDTASASNAARWVYSTGASALTPPGIGSVYAVSNDRVVHSMDPSSGAWPAGWSPFLMNAPSQGRPPVPTVNIAGTPTKVVYIGSQDGNVYCINASTGAQIWRTATPLLPTGSLVQAAPSGIFTTYGGDFNLIFAPTRHSSGDNVLYALNAATGAQAWSFNNGGGANGIGIISGEPWVEYGVNRVYFTSRAKQGGSSGTLWCLGFDGTTASLCSGYPKSIGDVDGSVTVYGGKVLIGNNRGVVYAFDEATGAQLWSFTSSDGPVKGFVTPDFTGATNRIYFTTTSRVWAIDDNGASATVSAGWPITTIPSPSIPIFTGSTVAVGASDGRLYEISNLTAATPAIKFVVLGAGTDAAGSPSLDFMSGRMFLGTDGGRIYAVTHPLP